MKPVTLNQLLFQPKTATLSFFYPTFKADEDAGAFDAFFEDMGTQLLLQGQGALAKKLSRKKSTILRFLKNHPGQCHGFFISDKLEGYIILESVLEPYCIIGTSFHVRPLIEEFFTNPEFVLVNISLYDIQVYKGDFHHLDIYRQYYFDEIPAIGSRLYAGQGVGLISFKTVLAMKTIALRIMDLTLYQNLPVIVTGLEDMKKIFLKYFDQEFGVITHFEEDFYEKTCVEIMQRCRVMKPAVMDFYSAQFKERLKRMMKSRRLSSDLGEIIHAIAEGKVLHLVIPSEKKVWGMVDFKTQTYEIHKRVHKKKPSVDIVNELAEEVIRQGGRIQILGPHYFPGDAVVMAVIKGRIA